MTKYLDENLEGKTHEAKHIPGRVIGPGKVVPPAVGLTAGGHNPLSLFRNYQNDVALTQKADGSSPERITHWLFGLNTELGELTDIFKKKWFYQKPATDSTPTEEIGDLLYYLAALANELGITLEDAATRNIAKLKKRYPNGFTMADARARKDKE